MTKRPTIAGALIIGGAGLVGSYPPVGWVMLGAGVAMSVESLIN